MTPPRERLEYANAVLAKNEMAQTLNASLWCWASLLYAEQRDILRDRANAVLQRLVKPHQDLQIYIESQSRAPLLCVVFDSNGVEAGRAGEDESWGVVELASLPDFTLHDRGQEVDSAASSARGAHMVYDRIAAAFKQKTNSKRSRTPSDTQDQGLWQGNRCLGAGYARHR